MKGYDHYKLGSFNQIFQYLGKTVIAPQAVLLGTVNLVKTLWEAQ